MRSLFMHRNSPAASNSAELKENEDMKKFVMAIAMVMIVSFTMATSLTDGLVGCWPFDGDAKDYSGNGNHGTTHGVTLTTDRHGRSRSAYHFGGKDYISVSGNGKIDSIADFTAATWIKVSAYDASDIGIKRISLICKGAQNRQFGLQFGVNTNEMFFFQLVVGESFYCREISHGQWTHIAVTRAGTSAVLYVNGSRATSGTTSAVIIDSVCPLTCSCPQCRIIY